MLKPTIRSQLSPLERHQVRTLIAKDTIALASIFLITVVLAAATFFLFQSYTTHRRELADRWFARGQKALSSSQPGIAIDDLHSALLYAPGQRQIEITLASALASAGRIAESTVYFNTLREAEPGNGEINLQLARLFARSGNEEAAKNYFHAAIYGNWEGDGYLKRRDTRLELVRYLISRGHFEQARSELLVAAGNAPSSDLQVQLLIAGLLVEDQAPGDASAIYKKLLVHAPEDAAALEGAAKTSYDRGRYQEAHQYLLKAVGASGSADQTTAEKQADPQRQADQELLRKTGRLIILSPSPDLAPSKLAARLLGDREIARRRLQECAASQASTQNDASSFPPGLSAVQEKWNAEPNRLTASNLASDYQLQQSEIQLVNETEKAAAEVCGEPSGDDAILLRLAQVPNVPGVEPEHE